MRPSLWPSQTVMNAIENMQEVRFHNVYILSHNIYYILTLITFIILTIKAICFLKVRQTLSIIFAMHYGDTKD